MIIRPFTGFRIGAVCWRQAQPRPKAWPRPGQGPGCRTCSVQPQPGSVVSLTESVTQTQCVCDCHIPRYSHCVSECYDRGRGWSVSMLGAICGSAISMDLLAQSMDPYSAQKSMDCADI